MPPDDAQKIDYDRINSSGEIFSTTFIFFKKYLRQIGWTALAAALFFCLASFITANVHGAELFSHPDEIFGGVSTISKYFVHDNIPLLPLINAIIFALVAYVPVSLMVREADSEGENEKWFHHVINYFKILVPITLFQLIMMTGSWYTFFLVFFVLPLLLLWVYIVVWEKEGIFQSLGRTFSLAGNNFGRILSLFFIFYLVGTLFYTFIDTGLLWFYFDVIGWNFSLDEDAMDLLLSALLAFTSIFFICLIFSMVVIGQSLQYHTLLEIEEAPNLKEKIKYIGASKRIQGIEKES